jgi:membrane-bound ClpP family serine protease
VSEPQRQQVRVRRSPKVGVFLLLGAIVGVAAAIVLVSVSPQDAEIPTAQAVGFLAVLLAPVGALVGGLVALVLDRRSERRARTVDAERTGTVVEDAAVGGAGVDGAAPAVPEDQVPVDQERSDPS